MRRIRDLGQKNKRKEITLTEKQEKNWNRKKLSPFRQLRSLRYYRCVAYVAYVACVGWNVKRLCEYECVCARVSDSWTSWRWRTTSWRCWTATSTRTTASHWPRWSRCSSSSSSSWEIAARRTTTNLLLLLQRGPTRLRSTLIYYR